MNPPEAPLGYSAYSPSYELVAVNISEKDLSGPGEQTFKIFVGGRSTAQDVTFSGKEAVTPEAIDYYLKLKKDLQFYEQQLNNPNVAREDVTRLSADKIKIEQKIRSFLAP